MLRPKKKVTKKEIKTDSLVTGYFEAQAWYSEHKTLMKGIALGIVGLVTTMVVVLNNIRAETESATAELGKVLPYYDQGNYEVALNGNPSENIRGLRDIVNDYGNTNPGEMAKLYLANSYYYLKQYDKALEYYQDTDLDDPLLMAAAYSGAGACLEIKGEYGEAAVLFEKAASLQTIDSYRAEQLHHAARNFAAAGNRQKAVELYKRITKEYPTSIYARDAERSIAQYSL
ncbi:MAG TPA: tetratricopeptide repeat protein [Bacteroidota bacterium]|nr:tetratricopeptide repeat protein [Bacteroidota bacterium]